MLIEKSIVVVADTWNPKIFTADWLNAHTHVKDFETEMLVPPLSVANSAKFKFVCDPQKLQLFLRDPESNSITELAKIAKSIVRKLPETKYVALGVNFKGRIDFPTEEEAFNFVKKYVSVKTIPDFCKENDDSLRVIVHLIKENILGSRLTIKMLPAMDSKTRKNVLVVDFNFHNDVKRFNDIKRKLENAQRKEQKSLKILEGLKSASA